LALLLPLSLLLGGGLLSLGGGVCVFGLLGFGDDGCVGQVALASITDPSGHVLVVGDFDCGANVCVHDGSLGFFVQSIVGGVVPEVQLPAAHVVPLPFPSSGAGIEVLRGRLGTTDDMLDVFVRFPDVELVTLMGIVAFAGITVNVADLEVGL
jgi:hypothetical protein